MATRHSIVHIEFQANAGKANAALKALQSEAARTKAEVERLRGELSRAKAANLPTDQIQKLEAELKKARTEHRQWQSALDNNLKGVRALDEAIKMFNKGKGSVEGMNAALSKTALNAAKLQQNRSDEGSKTWKEMDALAVALNQNIMRCNTALNQMIGTIKSGGPVSKSTLTQAKTDLQQMIALEEQGSKGWVKYTGQLKVVEGALNKLAAEEQRMAAQNVMSKVFSGQYVTKSRSELEKMIATLQQYQATIQDPKGNGARHYAATETAIKKLSAQLGITKGDIVTVDQALAVAADANNRFANQISQSIQVLRQQQGAVNAGTSDWKKYEAAINELTEREKIMRGEAVSLADALRLSATAGTSGFSGTAQQLKMAQQAIEKAFATTEKGTAKYAKLQQALARIKGESAGAGMTLQQMQQILSNPKAVKSVDTLKNAVARARAELELMGQRSARLQQLLAQAMTTGNTSRINALRDALRQNTKAYDDLAASTKRADQAQKELASTSKGSATAFEKAWSRLKTYISLYVGAAVAMQKIVSTFSDLMTLSDKMGEVMKTTGFTADEVGRLSDNLRKFDVRTNLVSLMETAAKAGQLGLKTEQDVLGFTEAANKMMIALPEMGNEAATEMMKVATATGEVDKIRKEMQEGLIEGSSAVAVAMTKIGSTIDQLRANSAAAAPQITDFVKRVGAVGAQSGISIDQVAALGATVDALGLRVEMSATALSRMIPAIRNNAFNIAKTIGVTPEVIRQLFDAGRGMDVILMIFQHIKEAGLDEDSIESLLGMAGMKDVMKELNQMGARAGIVFAGLSQNVDELRKNLGIASEAYEENMAIEREFQKMNETTAAKWERLKNQVEESFVSDRAQRMLGGIIDGLRWLVDFLTGNLSPALNAVSTAVKTLMTAWFAFKIGLGEAMFVSAGSKLKSLGQSIALVAMYTKQYIGLQWQLVTAHGAQEKAAIRAKIATLGFNKALKANVIMAVVAALGYLAIKWWENANAIKATDKAFADLEREYNKQVNTVDTLFHKLAKLREQERMAAVHAKEQAEAEAAKAAATEKGTAATEDYMKKLSLVDMLEKQRAETEKFFADNLKRRAKTTEEAAQAEQTAAKATEEMVAAGKGLAQQSELIRGLEEQRASIMDFLTSQHLKEVTVIGDKTKAMQNLAKQNELIKGLEEQRASIMEQLTTQHLKEVVVVGDRAKAEKALSQQFNLINSLEATRSSILEQLNTQHLQGVTVVGKRRQAEESLAKQFDLIQDIEKQRAAVNEILMQQHLQEVVVIGDRTKAEQAMAKQSELIRGLEEQRAAIGEILMQQHLQEVVVTGDRTKAEKALTQQSELIRGLEKQRADVMEVLNARHLQEVVVIGDKTKAMQNLAEQNVLIKGLEEQRTSIMEQLTTQHLREVTVIGDRTKAEQALSQQSQLIAGLERQRASIMEQLTSRHLQEVVVIGDRTKAEKALVQQFNLINDLEQQRAGIMEMLTTQHLKEVTVIGSKSKAMQNLAKQNELIRSLEEQRTSILEQLTSRQLQEVVVIGDRTKAEKSLVQQSELIRSLEEQRAGIMEMLTSQHLKEVTVIGDRTKAEKALTQQSALIKMLEEQRTATEGLLMNAVRQTTEATGEATKANSSLATEEQKVAEQTGKVEEGMHRVNIEGSKSADVIRSINSKYGQYLGYMLSETTSAQQLAAARELINKKLRETITLKQQEAALGDVEQEYGGKVNKKASKMDKEIYEVFGSNYDAAARVSVAISEAAQKYAKDEKAFEQAVQKILRDNSKYIDKNNERMKELRDSYGAAGISIDGEAEKKVIAGFTSDILDEAKNYREAVATYQDETAVVNRRFEATNNINRRASYNAAIHDMNEILGDWKELVARYKKAEGEEKEKLAAEVYRQQRNYANAFANNSEYFGDGDKNRGIIERQIGRMKNYEKGLRSVAGEAIRTIDAMEHAESSIANINLTNNNENSQRNSWGGKPSAESTDYRNMSAEVLVNRRKQMADFVNAIQTDTDVQSVLKEDAALKKAIEAGMSSDMRTVIEWYNTERLKIQDELHARHLTNTGDWLDPKKERGAKKQFRDEMDAYLHELDAYYTERKTVIEQARNDEEITEGEAWRRTIQNDNEWQTRRAELQKLYSRKQKEVTQEELDAIIRIIAERTGDSESFVKAAIAKTNQFVDAIEKSGDKGAAIVHRWMSQVVLDTERSYLKAAQAIGKQMKFIEDTLAKERPYDGITKNLQDNLDKMGVLAAKYRRENEELARQGKGPKYSNEQITAQSYDEMAFYLEQAADAYSIDIDELLRRMVKEGMTATAEEISKSDMLKQAVMGQLRKTYQEVQDAIKKEASQIKKDVEIIWNDDARGIGGMSMKATFDKALAQLGMQQDSVSRANSLIGAGVASDNVASRLAMKQIEVQMRMQKAQYDMYRVQANQRMAALKAEAEEHRKLAKLAEQKNDIVKAGDELLKATNAERDAENVRLSLGLTLAEETKKQEQQKAELLKIQEESQNRLYTSLREWADLLTSSLQGVFEASHAGDAEYYNERAKLDLTGKGGPGAGTYVVIDDAGTSDAKAHYEYLDERQALERQHEIEVQNAQAEAWRKLMDDLNMKMSEQITDWLNAAAQNASVDANTDATLANTEAIVGLTAAMDGKVDTSLASGLGYEPSGNEPNPTIERIGYETEQQATQTTTTESAPSVFLDPNNVGLPWEQQAEAAELSAERQVGAIDKVKVALDDQFHKQEKGSKESSQKMTSSTQSAFAKMTAAANLYGIAYQAMSNDNLSAAQKFSMMAIQAAGQSAITALTVDFSKTTADAAMNSASVLGKLWSQLGWGAVPVYAIFTGLLGGLMGLAASKIAKSKSEIAQATGASVGAGRLSTGMLTYAEGNVNELTDPASLTSGRQYNVDGADGKTYRARYMGKGAKTHITNGPEFHLVGEAGPEAIIDARTTRLLQMDETGIWRDIQTLYNGGSISGLSTRRRRGGVRAFADGNIGEFDEMADGGGLTAEGTGGMNADVMASMLETNSRLADLLENALVNGIKAVNKWTGSDGIPAMYNKMQKEAQRHGEKYL